MAKDIDLLRDLNHKIMVNNPRFDPAINPDWEKTDYGRRFFKERCIDSKWYTIIAEANGKAVGYLNGSLDNFGYRKENTQIVAVIENIGVIPEYQSKGIGKALIEDFSVWAIEKKAFQVQLTCFAKNGKALDWYSRLGFELSDVIMQKLLEGKR